MGNSNSQLKRSRSQYGSTRSVAFSLPSNWDRRSYAYGEQQHHKTSDPSTNANPKPILRNNSIASMPSNLAAQRSHLKANGLSRSMHSLQSSQYQQDMRSGPYGGSNINVSQSQKLSQKQYQDIYHNNDLKRVFRAQDRSNSVANLSSADRHHELDSASNLDRKLEALRAQRESNIHDSQYNLDKKEGATEKRVKSRKSKKAPQPNASMLGGTDSLNKVEGLYRKKGMAPQPPLRTKALSLPSLVEGQDLQIESHPPVHEIETKQEERSVSMSLHGQKDIAIPKPDYEGQSAIAKGVLVMPADTNFMLTKPKHKAPLPAKQSGSSLAKTSQDAFSSANNVIVAQNEVAKRNVVTNVEVHCEPEREEVKTQQSLTNASQPAKKEVREIAIQYDAPVEIAIQCSGNTLKQRNLPETSDSSSLAELLDMFNDAIKAGKIESTSNRESVAEKCDAESISSKASSSCERNSAHQRVVPMNQVLASVPEPPPLPDSNVKFIQKRTLKDDAPLSLAPDTLPSIIEKSSDKFDTPPKHFSTFQQQLLVAYEKIEEKRKTKPTEINSRSTSSNSQIISPLEIYRYSDTILGVKTPQEIESDSGNDEPSDSSISHGDQTPSIPDFVFAGIVKGFDTEVELASSTTSTSAVEKPVKRDKSKFNSIKRLTKSVRQLVAKRRDFVDESASDIDCNMETTACSDDNWTFSGRSKSSRSAMSSFDMPTDRSIHSGQLDKERSPSSTLSSDPIKRYSLT